MAQTFTSFTPVEEAEAKPPANFTSFTPLEATPAPVKPVDGFASTTAPVQQKPAVQPFLPPPQPKPEPDKSFSPIEELSKGAVGAATVGIPSSVEQFKLAGSAEVLGNTIQRLQLLDKIDKGEIKSPNELPRDPQARAYFASGPDVRSRLRQSINNDLTKNQTFVNTSLSLLAQYQREGQKYAGRQEKVLESESAADFGNWLTNKIGAGAVYAVPSIIAAITTKQPGLFVLGTGMGYTEAVSNRLEAMATATLTSSVSCSLWATRAALSSGGKDLSSLAIASRRLLTASV